MHYHTRGSHRDDAEAARFIDTLVERLRPKVDATILDLACGTGRYARRLASRGYRVLGIDLSTRRRFLS